MLYFAFLSCYVHLFDANTVFFYTATLQLLHGESCCSIIIVIIPEAEAVDKVAWLMVLYLIIFVFYCRCNLSLERYAADFSVSFNASKSKGRFPLPEITARVHGPS